MDAVPRGRPAAAPASVRVECVSSRRALAALRREWDVLWGSIPTRTPFQHTAWLYPWWEAFGNGGLRILAFRDGPRLVAVVPLYLSRTDDAGGEVRLLGAGVSDYLDMLVAPGAEAPVLAALARALEDALGEWTFCGFDCLRPGSALLRLCVRQVTSDTRESHDPCPAMALPGSIEALRDTIGAHLAKDIRYGRRRAERIGGLTAHEATSETVSQMLEALFSLHATRWSLRGGGGVLADPAVRSFHRAAAPELLAAGLLRMYALRVGSSVAAVYYGLQAAGRAYFYIGGFDPVFSALGPGKLAIAAAVERAVAEGASTFDFLAGREAYKYEWQAIDHPRFDRHLRRSVRRGAGA
jgi:CelD/BcsL family acetyltransferase involved in cellulose biosynthesis